MRTLPALDEHHVGVPAVVTHHLETLVWNVLRDGDEDWRDEITRAEYLKFALNLRVHSHGIVGGLKEDQDIWNGMKMPMKELTVYEQNYIKKVDLNWNPTPKEFQIVMEKAAKANGRVVVPKNIDNILVFTPEDTLIQGSDKTKSHYIKTYRPKYQIKVRIILKLETKHQEW